MKYLIFYLAIAANLLASAPVYIPDERVVSKIVESLHADTPISYADSRKLEKYVSVIAEWFVDSGRATVSSINDELEKHLAKRHVREVVRLSEMAKILIHNKRLIQSLETQCQIASASLEVELIERRLEKTSLSFKKYDSIIERSWEARARTLPALDILRENEPTRQP